MGKWILKIISNETIRSRTFIEARGSNHFLLTVNKNGGPVFGQSNFSINNSRKPNTV